MRRSLVLLFACTSGLSVANVYYAQPLLDALAADFAISAAAAGGVVTATQAGSALALLLLVPLGDLLPRRRLMLIQLLMLAAALAGVCLASSVAWLMAGMLAVGMLGTAMTQGLIAYAASASQETERGSVVGAAQSGVVIGLLLARVFAGLVADMAGWRGVYAVAGTIMLALAVVLWRALPPAGLGAMRPRSAYRRLIASMFVLLWRDRVLQVRGLIALLMFAVFNAFWAALVFLLAAPPYRYSHTAIGAFGLVGAAGAVAAAQAGRWTDRGHAQAVSAASLLLMLLAWVPLAWAPSSLAALAGGILLLDLAVAALHVTNQSLILRGDASAHSRLIACYMMFYAVGSGAGAIATTSAYAADGWHGVCILGAALSLLALGFWRATKLASPDCKSGRTNLEWSDHINQ